MKKILYAIISVAAVLSLASCEKLLTVSPIDEVSADTFLKNEQELKLFATGLIQTYQPTADDILKISSCDLFLYVGGTSDAWVRDALENARIIAGAMPLKNFTGLMPPIVLTVIE